MHRSTHIIFFIIFFVLLLSHAADASREDVDRALLLEVDPVLRGLRRLPLVHVAAVPGEDAHQASGAELAQGQDRSAHIGHVEV